MANLAPSAVPRSSAAERTLGAVLLIFGLSLALLAYTALGKPGGRQAGSTLLHPVATPPVGVLGTEAAGAPQDAGSARGSAAAGTASTPPAGQAAGSATGVPLVVLDNTGRPEVARAASQRFSQAGWAVTHTSTFQGDILSTAAYYDPAIPGAKAAAEALQHQFPDIQRVRPKFVGLGSGPVIVVLTFDYSRN